MVRLIGPDYALQLAVGVAAVERLKKRHGKGETSHDDGCPMLSSPW